MTNEVKKDSNRIKILIYEKEAFDSVTTCINMVYIIKKMYILVIFENSLKYDLDIEGVKITNKPNR